MSLVEPVAAALANGARRGRAAGPTLVLDVGGGTTDISLVDEFEGILEVLATDGAPSRFGLP